MLDTFLLLIWSLLVCLGIMLILLALAQSANRKKRNIKYRPFREHLKLQKLKGRRRK